MQKWYSGASLKYFATKVLTPMFPGTKRERIDAFGV